MEPLESTSIHLDPVGRWRGCWTYWPGGNDRGDAATSPSTIAARACASWLAIRDFLMLPLLRQPARSRATIWIKRDRAAAMPGHELAQQAGAIPRQWHRISVEPRIRCSPRSGWLQVMIGQGIDAGRHYHALADARPDRAELAEFPFDRRRPACGRRRCTRCPRTMPISSPRHCAASPIRSKGCMIRRVMLGRPARRCRFRAVPAVSAPTPTYRDAVGRRTR